MVTALGDEAGFPMMTIKTPRRELMRNIHIMLMLDSKDLVRNYDNICLLIEQYSQKSISEIHKEDRYLTKFWGTIIAWYSCHYMIFGKPIPLVNLAKDSCASSNG